MPAGGESQRVQYSLYLLSLISTRREQKFATARGKADCTAMPEGALAHLHTIPN